MQLYEQQVETNLEIFSCCKSKLVEARRDIGGKREGGREGIGYLVQVVLPGMRHDFRNTRDDASYSFAISNYSTTGLRANRALSPTV